MLHAYTNFPQLSMKDTRIYCQLVHPDCQKDDEGMISASIKLASICSCKINSTFIFRKNPQGLYIMYLLYSILTICKLGLPM